MLGQPMQKWLPRMPLGPSLTCGTSVQTAHPADVQRSRKGAYLQSGHAETGHGRGVPEAYTCCKRDALLERKLLEDAVDVCIREVRGRHLVSRQKGRYEDQERDRDELEAILCFTEPQIKGTGR